MNAGQYVFIDSYNRIHSVDTPSDFTININTQFENNQDLKLQVQNLTIPSSWYNVNANNYQIGITAGVSGYTTLSIPQGNYSTSSFLPALRTAGSTAGLSVGITGSYSSLTGKFSLQTDDLSDWKLDITRKNGKYLGLTEGVHSSSSGIITSDKFVDFSGTREIRIVSDLTVQSANSWNKNSNVLLSVYPNVASGEFVNYQIEAFAPMYIQGSNLNNNIRFMLFDEFNDKLDLNGMDWSMTFVAFEE